MSCYIDTINIEKTTASETYNKSPGKMELSAGSKKNRLKFELLSNDIPNQTANVYVEVIGDDFLGRSKSFILSTMPFKFLKTTHKGKIIYININSLSNRLGIKVEKICSDEAFNAALKKQFEIVRETEKKIDAFFQEIKTRYTEDGNDLKTVNGEPIISKTDFRKLLGLTAFSKFTSKQKQEASYSLKDGNILFLKKQEDQEWPLLTLFTKDVLGEGACGKVLTVQELSMGRLSVAKVAYDSELHEDIKNESIILNKIFTDSNPVGIQQKPYSLFNFKDINYRGYIAPKYDCSLSSVIRRLKPDEKIESVRQLLKGLQELENQQIIHGDIKEANCLFRRKSNGSIECVIADFGGAVDLSKKAKWPDTGTPFYESDEDHIAYRSLRRKLRSEKITDARNEINTCLKNLLLRKDIYAMGIVLGNLLGSYIKKESSKELSSLIDQMLETSWEKRISATEALVEFEKIFPCLNSTEAV
ncbi:protein kinase [Candidatus Rhabdochlamydia sp. T3358]|uniref:protein kinase domain-containing protein n=1 Tax=Candidatus Rhabdochlamydia sp. T3358 TaxID=2099795 RepID=UPI0010B9E556|nr:protein kinase [Candidatus Rhabdochlamydia sp. T3358]VHO03000.1 Protein kinase domain protein [Candidatus Rhabdochlamydia sp. T3358]